MTSSRPSVRISLHFYLSSLTIYFRSCLGKVGDSMGIMIALQVTSYKGSSISCDQVGMHVPALLSFLSIVVQVDRVYSNGTNNQFKIHFSV